MNTQQLSSTTDFFTIRQEILSLLQLREDELSEDHLSRLRLLTEAVSEKDKPKFKIKRGHS
jgi:hypothetical protein